MQPVAAYAAFLQRFLKPSRPLRVVFDCSNGTAGLVIRQLSNLVIGKLKAILINDKPDGNFPAHGPDPMRPGAIRQLSREVVRRKADCGVIFDADGDRVFFVDDRGRTVSPDHAAILIGMAFKGPVILDLRMGYAAREWFAAKKRKVVDSRVGHFFIKKLMRARKIPYAAELSGHYYFRDFFYCDSGIFAAIMFLNNLSSLPSLSEWIDTQPKYYQTGEINFNLSDANRSRIHANDAKGKIMKRIEAHYKKAAARISHLDGVKLEFPNFWLNVRPSNTEDLLRLNLEAKGKTLFDREMKTLKELMGLLTGQ